MDSVYELYLREVLGVTSFVAPEGHRWVPVCPRKLAVFCETEPTSEEVEILNKMLDAIQIDKSAWRLFTPKDDSSNEVCEYGISFGSPRAKASNSWIELQSLNSYLGSGEKITAFKKEAWQKLKSLKTSMERNFE